MSGAKRKNGPFKPRTSVRSERSELVKKFLTKSSSLRRGPRVPDARYACGWRPAPSHACVAQAAPAVLGGRAALQRRKKMIEKPLPCAAGSRAAGGGATKKAQRVALSDPKSPAQRGPSLFSRVRDAPGTPFLISCRPMRPGIVSPYCAVWRKSEANTNGPRIVLTVAALAELLGATLTSPRSSGVSLQHYLEKS